MAKGHFSSLVKRTVQRSPSDGELAGRWVAVDATRTGLTGLRDLPTGGVLVDYDTELDLLCQRVAEAGHKSLTIFRYDHERPRDAA